MKKFCIVEYPKKANLSHLIYNNYFNKINLNAKYYSLEVKPDIFDTKITDIIKAYEGINFTNPFKVKALRYLKLDPYVGKIGSANCAYKGIAFNTDWIGIYKSIDTKCIKEPILIIGAGGVARSFVYALNRLGIRNITIANRTLEKAIELSKLFSGLRVIPFDELKNNHYYYNTLVNCTTVGMNGDSFEFIDPKDFNYIFDVIYYKTPLQIEALKKSICFTSGKKMWYYQAIENLKIWGIYDKVTFKQIFNKLIGGIDEDSFNAT